MDLPASSPLDRRAFLRTTALGVAAMSGVPAAFAAAPPSGLPGYRGPNVIVVRWGGGARRRESIEPRTTYAPFLTHGLAKRGVLFPRMEIAQFEGLNTSHGEGTLNLLTGKYDERGFDDASNPGRVTLFDRFRTGRWGRETSLDPHGWWQPRGRWWYRVHARPSRPVLG